MTDFIIAINVSHGKSATPSTQRKRCHRTFLVWREGICSCPSPLIVTFANRRHLIWRQGGRPRDQVSPYLSLFAWVLAIQLPHNGIFLLLGVQLPRSSPSGAGGSRSESTCLASSRGSMIRFEAAASNGR